MLWRLTAGVERRMRLRDSGRQLSTRHLSKVNSGDESSKKPLSVGGFLMQSKNGCRRSARTLRVANGKLQRQKLRPASVGARATARKARGDGARQKKRPEPRRRRRGLPRAKKKPRKHNNDWRQRKPSRSGRMQRQLGADERHKRPRGSAERQKL